LKSANKFIDVDFITFNNEADLAKITTRTAGIVLETIQGGAGFIQPHNDFLKKVRERCTEVGLMILDEIQPGFGRTGNFDSRIMMLSHVVGKGMGGCLWALYRINRNDGFIE
jgi:acetylornithine/succinyldiaminopimelate/putrescine aminotransferase